MEGVMSFRSSLIGIAAATLISGMAAADPLDDAAAAYKRGDYQEALRLMQPEAEKGTPTAQYDMGVFYSRGRAGPKDYDKALHWFRLAADQNNANAQYEVGE